MYLELHNYIQVGKRDCEALTARSLRSARGILMLRAAFQKPWPFRLLTALLSTSLLSMARGRSFFLEKLNSQN